MVQSKDELNVNWIKVEEEEPKKSGVYSVRIRHSHNESEISTCEYDVSKNKWSCDEVVEWKEKDEK